MADNRISNRAPMVQRSSGVELLYDPKVRRRMGIRNNDQPISIVVELNLYYPTGLTGAVDAVRSLYKEVVTSPDRRDPELIANTYLQCELSVAQTATLVKNDRESSPPGKGAIYRVWPDFPAHPLIYRTVSTIKADAAQRSFAASGKGIVWAVIDSGVDANHAHFKEYETLTGPVAGLHRDFVGNDSALTDEFGHGTHVAGIIAGGLPETADLSQVCVGEHVRSPFSTDEEPDVIPDSVQPATLPPGSRLTGMAPHCKIVSLKVLDASGSGRTTDIMRALQYVREEVNGNGKALVVHGVNLSVGYEFNVEWFACGQSPLCVEVNRLVRTGVVVVVAAGNTGYGIETTLPEESQTNAGLLLSINDPGNADLAVTVGATHGDSPHTYGVSFFSSKGPTGDGRFKPDLVAPGERITSCAAGKILAGISVPTPETPVYVDLTGTSMAAPHVSGAVAAFLSIRREYVGQAEEVKRIFLESATSLGRDRYFQGYGLVDLMRAVQSV